MVYRPLALLLFSFALAPAPASADTAYSADGGFCGAAQSLRAPAAPPVACENFRAAHAALINYARDVVAACARGNAGFHAARQKVSAACPAGPAASSDACGSAMFTAEGELANVERSFSAVKEPHEKTVRASFPAQGARITASCLPTLDALQEFSYAVSGALQASVRQVQSERSSLQGKVSNLLRQREARR